MLLQLYLDICMCQGILNWQACTLQLWLTGENHILGWLCSCARIMQQMFCSQRKSLHRLRVEQALSLVLTSGISFGSDVLALGTPSTAGHSCTEAGAVWSVEKGRAPWSVCLDADPKLSLFPQSLPKPWSLCQAVHPHPGAAHVPAWLPDSSLCPCVAVPACGWLSPHLPSSSSVVRALPLALLAPHSAFCSRGAGPWQLLVLQFSVLTFEKSRADTLVLALHSKFCSLWC